MTSRVFCRVHRESRCAAWTDRLPGEPAPQEFSGTAAALRRRKPPSSPPSRSAELPNIDITVSSQTSPELAEGLTRGRLDLAFLRPEPSMRALKYKVVMQEPLVVVMPSDHRLAVRKAIAIQDVAAETFLGMSKTAPVLQVVIDDYLKRSGIEIAQRTRSTILPWRSRSSPPRAA
jgi:DNA-binding transcriptional LysR family regulator